MKIHFAEKKYTIVTDDNDAVIDILRYGERWPAFYEGEELRTIDNLTATMIRAIIDLAYNHGLSKDGEVEL